MLFQDVNELVFKKVLAGLIKHINSLHSEIQVEEGILPCEILLTGTNLPDHNLLIFALTDSLLKEVTPFISTLWSRNCGNIRSAVTSLVQQILNVATQDESINVRDSNLYASSISFTVVINTIITNFFFFLMFISER